MYIIIKKVDNISIYIGKGDLFKVLRSFCIKINNQKIIDQIMFELENTDLEEIYITNRKFKNYKNVIVHYKGKDVLDFYALIAGVITKIIKKYYELLITKSLLISNYFYFTETEREDIIKICQEFLNASQKEKLLRYNLVFSECFDYIRENRYLILDGFINFRLKKYIKDLDEIVDLAVDKYVIDREYNEFTSLLKTYVATKEPEESIIHLIYQSQESILLNEDKQVINTSSSIFDAKYLSDISFSSNDYALNALLNLLPKQLYIHLIDGKEDEFIETLELIFDKRSHICTDCTICKIYRINKSHKIIIKE